MIGGARGVRKREEAFYWLLRRGQQKWGQGKANTGLNSIKGGTTHIEKTENVNFPEQLCKKRKGCEERSISSFIRRKELPHPGRGKVLADVEGPVLAH